MSDWSAFTKLGIACGKAAAGMPKVRFKAMSQATALLQRNTKEKIRTPGGGFGPLIAGKANNLLSDCKTEVKPDGSRGSMFFTKIYSEIMENGRRPGARRPPTGPIENWIKDKRIMERGLRSPRTKREAPMSRRVAALEGRLGRHSLDRKAIAKKGKGPRRAVSAADRKARAIKSLAFVIARSIGERGIVGRRYVAQALAKSMPHFDPIFASVGEFVVGQVATG